MASTNASMVSVARSFRANFVISPPPLKGLRAKNFRR